jgi:hypothetical protein
MLNWRGVNSSTPSAAAARTLFPPSDQRQQNSNNQRASKTVINVPSSTIYKNEPVQKTKPFVHASPRGFDEVDSGSMRKICLNSGRENSQSFAKKPIEDCECSDCGEYHRLKQALSKAKVDKSRDSWLSEVFDDAMSGFEPRNIHKTTDGDAAAAEATDGQKLNRHKQTSV